MVLSLGEKPKTAEAFGHKLEGGGETTTNGVGKHITKVAVKAISKHFLLAWDQRCHESNLIFVDNCCYVKVGKLDATVRL